MKSTFFLSAITALVLFSCSKTDDKPGTDNIDPTGKSDGKITNSNGVITISGTNNFEYKMAFENSGYIVNFKEKALGNLSDYSIWIDFFSSWTGLLPGSSSSLNSSSGLYESMDVTKFTDSDSAKFKIAATGEYVIEYKKLPLSTAADAMPKTYSGAGRRVFGPIALSATSSFVLNCADAKNAGFTAELFDASGEEILDSEYAILFVNLENNAIFNVIDRTITWTDLIPGNYYVNIDANGAASYTLTIQ
jgi:hypothetical protein